MYHRSRLPRIDRRAFGPKPTAPSSKIARPAIPGYNRILTPGGGRIIFQGMQNHTAESIKSLEGYDIAWVEEAQSLSKRSLELLRPTIR
ncbi:phage terminase large subunit, partial [Inquilinus limosus]|uniref:phage terminase large subunit n=1 Tax=Inquilinus limosus TaxID=171674 RepID=UPI001B7FD57E